MGGSQSSTSRTHLSHRSTSSHYVVEEEHCAQQQCLPSPSSSSSAAYSQAPVYPHASAYTQAPVYSRAPPARKLGKRLSRKYSHITDQFTSVEQVPYAFLHLSWLLALCYESFDFGLKYRLMFEP